MRVAVIGIGTMGHAVAKRLLEGGHTVTVWNRSPHKADDLVSGGAQEANSPAEAAAGAMTTFTSLTDDDAVREVVEREDGIGAGLREGEGILVDASTVSPQTTAAIEEAVSGRFLASPILGAPALVSSGEAVYLIGGSRELYDRVRPAYDALAGEAHVRYVGGDASVATTLKLLSNYLLMAGVATLAEAVAAAQAAGLSDDVVRDHFANLSMVAPGVRNRLDDIVAGDHDGWFSTTMGAKDVRLAQSLAQSHGVQLPLADAVKRRYEQAAEEGLENADIAAVVELVRRSRPAESPD